MSNKRHTVNYILFRGGALDIDGHDRMPVSGVYFFVSIRMPCWSNHNHTNYMQSWIGRVQLCRERGRCDLTIDPRRLSNPMTNRWASSANVHSGKNIVAITTVLITTISSLFGVCMQTCLIATRETLAPINRWQAVANVVGVVDVHELWLWTGCNFGAERSEPFFLCWSNRVAFRRKCLLLCLSMCRSVVSEEVTGFIVSSRMLDGRLKSYD